MLSRRDRAACLLALECLREMMSPVMSDACVRAAADVLESGGEVSVYLIFASLPEAIPTYQRARLLRARLALYLRALLRADRGDFGTRARCGWCNGTGCPAEDPRCSCCEHCDNGAIRRAPWRPLWELASPHS